MVDSLDKREAEIIRLRFGLDVKELALLAPAAAPRAAVRAPWSNDPGLRDAVEDFLVEERAGVQRWADEAREMLPYRHSAEP